MARRNGNIIGPARAAPNVYSAPGIWPIQDVYEALRDGIWAKVIYPPINTVAPVISGLALEGQSLSVTTGTWRGVPGPITYAYQWQRDSVDIVGATSDTYVVQSADFSSTVRCKVTATNPLGSEEAFSNGVFVAAPGQQQYGPGTYTWVAPEGVTSISVVCIGAGGGGDAYQVGGGGGGGGLCYKNNHPVTPGESYTVVVGGGGNYGTGGSTSFSDVMTAYGAQGARSDPPHLGGTATGGDANFSGGNGGVAGVSGQNGAGFGGGGGAAYSAAGGGGGAGGYGAPGGGGAGGPAGSPNGSTGGGGGVGLFGTTVAGTAGTKFSAGSLGGGSGNAYNNGPRPGAHGGARIIWPGATRQFPSTNVGDV